MKKILTTTNASFLIVALFFAGIIGVNALGIPLNQAPNVGSSARGQYKQGALTVGSSTAASSALTVVGTGLKISGVNCATAPFTGANAKPCPYSPFTSGSTGPELRILGNGSGIGGYMNTLVVGAPAGTAITSGSALDVVGTIMADPAPSYLNFAAGTYYQGSGTDKPLCALANGDIVVCGTVTVGTCGPANGTTMSTAPNANTSGLCATGTPAFGVVTQVGTYGWACMGSGGGSNAYCSATNSNYTGTGNPGGTGSGPEIGTDLGNSGAQTQRRVPNQSPNGQRSAGNTELIQTPANPPAELVIPTGRTR